MSPTRTSRPGVSAASLTAEAFQAVSRSFALVPRRRSVLAALSAASIVDIATFVAAPLLVGRVFDLATSHAHLAHIELIVVAYATVTLVGAGVGALRVLIVQRAGEDATRTLRATVLGRLQSLPYPLYVHAPTGVLVDRTLYDTMDAAAGSIAGGANLIDQVLKVAAAVLTLAVIDVRLAALGLLLTPLVGLPSRWATPRLRRASNATVDELTRTATFLGDRLNVEARLLSRQSRQQAADNYEARRRFDALRDQRVARLWLQARLGYSTAAASAVATAAVLAFGSALVALHETSAGTLVTFAVMVTQLFGPVGQLTTSIALTQEALSSWSRLGPLLDLEPTEPPEGDTSTHVRALRRDRGAPPPRVGLERVTFRYTPRAATAAVLALPDSDDSGAETSVCDANIADVSCVFEAGESVALVGPSGSGKTTIAHLIAGVIRPDAGSVRIGDCQLWGDERSPFPSGQLVALVPQTPFFHNDSVAANLRYGAPDVSLAELEQACAAAHILDRVGRLPSGFDTMLGESGWMLSGGERQRLAIARALLQDSRVLIFDEPTAHLDHDAEALIWQVLERLRGGRTVIVVTHRLGHMSRFDRVLRIERGRVVSNDLKPTPALAMGH